MKVKEINRVIITYGHGEMQKTRSLVEEYQLLGYRTKTKLEEVPKGEERSIVIYLIKELKN